MPNPGATRDMLAAMTEYAEQPEIIRPQPPATESALDGAPMPPLQYLPRRMILPQPPATEPASETAPEPSPHHFPRRFGFGIRSVTAIVLGVAIVVIASIVWCKPFAASATPKPQGPATTTPAAR